MGDSAPEAAIGDNADILSVAELNERIAAHLESSETFQDIWVRGEVSDCHETDVAVYFTLTSDEASVNCVLWQNRYDDIDIELENGLEVVLRGELDYYEAEGRLNVKPWRMHLLGEGERYTALERLRQDIADRGWFDESRKQTLPPYPACVGVVTSREGDARYDIQQSIHERYPDVDIRLCHASVQGDGAPDSLTAGIERLDADPNVDVIVTGRGGGSDEALMAFNTEAVSEAIVHAETPVVSAVGHREDETLADEVADETAITPTAAGTTVVPSKDVELEEVRAYAGHLEDAYAEFVSDRLDELERELTSASQSFARDRIAKVEQTLEGAYRSFEHERETERAIEQTQAETETTVRRYRILVALLIGLLLVLLAWVFIL